MASDALLSLRDVRVHYGKFLAVDGLSLELYGGQLLGLIGPNGAGKTPTPRAAPESPGDRPHAPGSSAGLANAASVGIIRTPRADGLAGRAVSTGAGAKWAIESILAREGRT